MLDIYKLALEKRIPGQLGDYIGFGFAVNDAFLVNLLLSGFATDIFNGKNETGS